MGVYHYCSTIYFGSIGQQTREIGTNVTFLGITHCSYLSKWVIFGGKSELFCTIPEEPRKFSLLILCAFSIQAN